MLSSSSSPSSFGALVLQDLLTTTPHVEQQFVGGQGAAYTSSLCALAPDSRNAGMRPLWPTAGPLSLRVPGSLVSIFTLGLHPACPGSSIRRPGSLADADIFSWIPLASMFAPPSCLNATIAENSHPTCPSRVERPLSGSL